jgi:hypothetical protein
MPNWLKYVISGASGFAGGVATASQSGAGLKGDLIGGALGAILSLGNLTASAPKDKEKVQLADNLKGV